MKRKTAKGKNTEIDEHDLPTEPVPHIIAPPEMNTMPAAPQQPITLGPFEQNRSYPAAPNAPKFDVYPYPPPTAPQANDASPSPAQAQKPTQKETPKQSIQGRRPFYQGFIPLCIGLCFVCIQLLLLTRFMLRLVGIAEGIPWVNTVYALCDILLLPFQALLPPLQLPPLLNLSARLEPYTLLAVFVYGITSRLIVRILKMLLRVRQPEQAQKNNGEK